jgi:hypothetical protein
VLRITEDDVHNCFVLEPSGSLTRKDFAALVERFNAKVNATDRIPNLVVHTRDFPIWADFAALLGHLRFIREHHKLVGKVALVSGARAVDMVSKLARHFVAAQIRHFPEGELDAALAWVAEAEEEQPHVTVMEGLPDDVIGISVQGVIGARDYAETIVPLIEGKLRDHAKLRLLYRVGPEFERFTPGAVWSDARVGMMHLTQFSRIAVVSDLEWIRHAMRVFAPLIPGEVHVFADAELDKAKTWITACDES